MPELLQLHVTVPDDDLGEYRPPDEGLEVDRYQDLLTLVASRIGAPPAVRDPSGDGGGWVSSRLFERRPDNMDAVEDIRYQLACRYPDADVFWSERPGDVGGDRSAGDPDTDIVLLVANWGNDAAHVCWETEVGDLRAATGDDGNSVYHLDQDGIAMTHADSGQTRWDLDLPGGPRRLIDTWWPIVAGSQMLTRVTSSGTIWWQTPIDGAIQAVTGSSVADGSSVVYVGVRSGAILSVAVGDGAVTELGEVSGVADIVGAGDSGVIVETGESKLVCLKPDGSEAWTRKVARETVGMAVQERVLYRATPWGIQAIDVTTDTTLWAVETAVVAEPAVADERVLVPTTEGLVALDLGEGSVDWDRRFPGGGRAGTPVVAHGEVATIQSRARMAGGDLPEFSTNTLRVVDFEDGQEHLSYDIGAGTYRLAPVANWGYLLASRRGIACVDTMGSPPRRPSLRSKSVS